jgi:hypothetical protein
VQSIIIIYIDSIHNNKYTKKNNESIFSLFDNLAAD